MVGGVHFLGRGRECYFTVDADGCGIRELSRLLCFLAAAVATAEVGMRCRMTDRFLRRALDQFVAFVMGDAVLWHDGETKRVFFFNFANFKIPRLAIPDLDNSVVCNAPFESPAVTLLSVIAVMALF